ncbi:hypothetical protein A4A49_03813 [Nicotiana attenuata]|uniref:Uncharacterized protein n=1 Tax=Nicotiana attenuata TaxID=49451 RepID=A0A1J6I5H6_NICAT|nr:hypothetical protein A4A49_03813 [Nicotiana attenuata]
MDDLDNGISICCRRSYSGREYKRFVSYKLPAVNRSNKAPAIWRLLWRKMKKEKKKIFERSKSKSMRFTYDSHSYSQNFDQGSFVLADAQELSRSFSARFAVPSRIFPNNELIV